MARSNRRLIAGLVGGALLSKTLGFARELLMAQIIGASLIADSFRGAIAAVLLPLVFLQNESVPAILIPMQRDALKAGDAPQRLGALVIAVTLVAIVLMLAVEALGAWWVDAVVGGFVPEGRAMTLEFVRVMALSMPASVMLNCLAAGEIALGRSRLTNIRASLLNLCIIFGLGMLALTGRVDLLAWAFTISFNVLAGWGLWSLWREGNLSFAGVTPAMVVATSMVFLRCLRPLVALPFAEQAHIWVERLMASRLATGAVASLDYARTLSESALLLISQPVGLGVLASHPPSDESARIEAIARPILAVALPASVFALVFAPDIVRLVFYRGAFTETGVLFTTQALRGIAVGLWASTLGWILLRILNSAGRNVSAAMILVAAYAMNIAVNLLTSANQVTAESGVLIIGLGDAARSIVLLAGTMLALGCRRRLSLLVLTAAGPAALMGLLGWQIHQQWEGMLPRLFAGGLACVLCIGLAMAILMPTGTKAVIYRIRGGVSAWRGT
jgi:putative peptidoglycan lipid II flippase